MKLNKARLSLHWDSLPAASLQFDRPSVRCYV